MLKNIVFILFLSFSVPSLAQVGRSFWFVVPGLMHDHGVNPILFRITAFDKPANVTISMPANPAFNPYSLFIGANKQVNYNLNTSVSENIPAAKVNNKGYLITSDQDVSIYYDVADSYNPDKFILKGNSALGTKFYIPSQNHFPISPDHKSASEKVDIVATEDNTMVSFTPPVAVVGHAALKPVVVTLNRGQTYCIENRDPSANSSMAGMLVTSTKEVAITISDDSVLDYWPHDLIGDQLIPVSMLGMEYIAMRTNNDKGSKHKVYLVGTQDGTTIIINNDPKNSYVINAGEQKMFDVTGSSIYIKSSSPIYAYQLTGVVNNNGNEFGSAILPSIVCTGSQKVSFTRTQKARFFIQLLSQKKNRDGFVLKNDVGTVQTNLLGTIKWEEVPGTSNGDATWYSAIIKLDISTGKPYIIENTKGLFHLSVLDENGGSLSYGYFSSYSALRISIPSKVCVGDVVTLTAEGDLNNVKWYSDKTGDKILGTGNTLQVTESGAYRVVSTSQFGDCTLSANADVVFQQPKVDLGPDVSICPGETVKFEVSPDEGSIKWHNNSTSPFFSQLVEANKSYKTSVTITNSLGCSNSDDVEIVALPAPVLTIGAKENVCRGSVLMEQGGFDRYQWVDGTSAPNPDDNKNSYVPSHSGTYHLTAWNAEGCSAKQNIDVTMNELPPLSLTDVIVCDQTPYQFTAPAGMTGYLWHDGSTSSSFMMSHPGEVSVKITDANGCVNQDMAKLGWYAKPNFVSADDFSVCEGADHTIVADASLSGFEWFFDDGVSVKNLNNNSHQYKYVASQTAVSGTFIIKAKDLNGCEVEDRVQMTVLDKLPLDLGPKRDICQGNSVQLLGSVGFDSYQWAMGGASISNNKDLSVKTAGTYFLTATATNGCKSEASVVVDVHALPKLELKDVNQQCQGTSFTLDVNSFETVNGASHLTYQWQALKNGAWEILTGAEFEKVPLVVHNAGERYRLTVYDDLGCSDFKEVQPEYFKPLKLIIDSEASFCDNSSFLLQSPLKAGVDVASYQWFKDASGSSSHGEINQSWSVQSAGTYVLAVTDLNGCAANSSIQLTAVASPVFSIGADREICEGTQTSLSIDGGLSFSKYQWNNNPLDNQPSKVVGSAGIYDLKVWNNMGCSASKSVKVSVNPLPVVALSDAITCSNGSHTFKAPSGFNHYLWQDGSSLPNLTVNSPCDVNVVVTDHKGCENVASAKFEWFKETAFEKTGDIRLCEGSDYVIKADATLNNFQWFVEKNGVTTNLNHSSSQWALTNVQLSANGSVFIIRANDNNGCSIEDRSELKVDVTKPLNLGADRYICKGDTIQLVGNHGFEVYNWTSSDGVISHKPYVLVSNAGIYHLEAIHYNGCVSSDEVKVDVHDQPSLTMTAIKDQCQGTDFTLSINHFMAANGPAVRYEWSSFNGTDWKVLDKEVNSSLKIPESMVGELFRVVAYDHLGCFAIGEQQPNYHPSFEVKLDDKLQTCDNAPFVLHSPYQSGVDVMSYQWFKDNNASAIAGKPNADFQVDVQPNHQQFGTYLLAVVDLHGCTSEGVMEVIPFDALLLNLGSDKSFCDGDQVRIKDVNGTVFEKYLWNGNPSDNLSYKEVDQPGLYTLQVWDMNGCSDQKSISITKHSLPALNIPDLKACANTEHTFIAPSGMASYMWHDGSRNSSFTQKVPGEVSVTITDMNGCQNSTKSRFDWFDAVDLKPVSDIQICEGLPLSVDADPQLHSFNWSFNGVNLNHNTNTYSVASVVKGGSGRFVIDALDVNNCKVQDDFMLNVLEKAPLMLMPIHDICDGSSVELDGNQGFVAYDWSLNGLPFSQKAVVQASQAGNYHLIATHANTCRSEASVFVQTHDLPVLTMEHLKDACVGASFTLAMKSFDTKNGNSNPKFQWSNFSNGTWTDMGGGSSIVVTDVSKRYRLTVTDDLGCSDSKELQPRFFDPLSLSLPAEQSFCDNSSFTLVAPVAVGVDVSDYRWYQNGVGDPTHGLANQEWVVNRPGKYVLSVSDLNGCMAEASTQLKTLSSPLFTLGDDRAICYGEGVNIEVGYSNQFVKFMWNDVPGDNQPRKEINSEGLYKLTAWNKNGCSASDDVYVTVNSLPVVDLGPDQWGCTGFSASLDASPGFAKYQWSNGANSQKVDVPAGEYSVLVTDNNGCVGGDMAKVSWFPVPNVDLGPDEYVCPLAEPVLDAGSGFVSYLWHNGSTSSTINAVVGDLHQVFVTDKNGCTGMDSKYVLPLTTPSLWLDSVQSVCDNQKLVLDAGAGFQYYRWNDGSSDQTLVPTTPGLYFVEVSDGCFVINDSVQVSFLPSPVVMGVDSTFYKQLIILASGGTLPFEYQLNNGQWQDNSTFTDLENGHHHFIIRDANDCRAEYDVDYTSFINISVPPIITPNGDGFNDTWVIPGIERSPESRIRIYDRFGKMLANYQATDPGWDGLYLGKPLPTDSYWYVIEIKPGNKLIKGFLTLKR